MDGYFKEQLICRACLRVVENTAQSFGFIEDSYGSLKDMIMCCVPEMDIYVSSKPIMCLPCIQQLISVYNFKTRCLNTETVIRSYIQRNNLMEYSHVNLSCVVQELVRLNNYANQSKRNKAEAQDVVNAHLEATKENLPNTPENQVSETISDTLKDVNNATQNRIETNLMEEVNTQSQEETHSTHNIVQSDTVENRTVDESSRCFQTHEFAECFPDKVDPQEISQYVTSESSETQIIHRNFIHPHPPPHLIQRQNFYQHNFPINHMGQRMFPYPPINNHHNFRNHQMGERMFLPPPPSLDHRISPYNLHLRGQMPERIFASPQLQMEQRFAPRFMVPGGYVRGHMGERIYALPPTNLEQRLPQYGIPAGIPANHVSERIYYVHPTGIEDIPKPMNGAVDGHFPHLQADELNEAASDHSPKQVEGQPVVESNNDANEGGVNDSSEENGSKTDEKVNEEQPEQNKARIILRIDKSRIINFTEPYDKNTELYDKNTEPYDKNEDSNEKENEQEEAEMSENGIAASENDVFLQPSEYSQELYQCTNCTFVTTNLNYHIAHKKICLNELEKNEKKCPHCPHVTNRQYALNKHINTMHTKAVWYTCDYCTYRSTDSSCLRRHKRNVHPERVGNELTCQMCSYRCTTEYHLRKHMLKHDENTILQCQFCSYSTRDRSNFRKHVFIHNPKPKECEFCDYKCVSPYQMKVHLKKYHHGVGMEDIDCRSDVSLSEVVDDISNAINESKCYIGHLAE